MASSSKCSTAANDILNDYLQQCKFALMQQSQNGAGGGNLAQTLLTNQMLSSATRVSAANQQPTAASNLQSNINNNFSLLFNADPMIVSFFTFLSHFALRLFTHWNIPGCSKTSRTYSWPNSASKGCTGIYFSSSELCQFLSLIKCVFILIDLIWFDAFSFYSLLFLSAFYFTTSHPVTIYHCIYKSFM